jgi:hypothetical protein
MKCLLVHVGALFSPSRRSNFVWRISLQNEFFSAKTIHVPFLFPPFSINDKLWPLQSPEVTLIFSSLLRSSYISSAGICVSQIFISILLRFLHEVYCNQVPITAVNSFYSTWYGSSLFLFYLHITRKMYIYLRNF